VEDNRKRVAELIRGSFAGVQLGSGIGLREAQGIDDYEKKAAIASLRDRDEKHDWSAIAPADLTACASSLSFFDAEGMRFHLPAFLVAELEGSVFHCAVFPLMDINEYKEGQYASLSTAQRRAVREFLLVIADDPEFEFEREGLRRALAEYWDR